MTFSVKKDVCVTQIFLALPLLLAKVTYSLERSYELNCSSNHFHRECLNLGSYVIKSWNVYHPPPFFCVWNPFLDPFILHVNIHICNSTSRCVDHMENGKREKNHVDMPHVECSCFSSANSLHSQPLSWWVISSNSCLGLETKMLVEFSVFCLSCLNLTLFWNTTIIKAWLACFNERLYL